MKKGFIVNIMEEGFIAHLCVNAKNGDPQMRPYSTLLCSLCKGELGGSTNITFPNRKAYDKASRNKTKGQ